MNPDGTVGSPLALGADAIRALVARTVGPQAEVAPTAIVPAPVAMAPSPNGNGNGVVPPAPAPNGTVPLPVVPATRIGQPAPALRLADLDGRMVDLANFRGSRTLVLFWNTGCGFCRQMLDTLKAWEANPPAGAPKLLVVATGGTVEEFRKSTSEIEDQITGETTTTPPSAERYHTAADGASTARSADSHAATSAPRDTEATHT